MNGINSMIVGAITAMSAITALAIVAVAVSIKDPGHANILIGQIVAAMVPTTVALVGLLKVAQAQAGVDETKSAVQAVHTEINSRMSKLLEVTDSAARAEGVLQGASTNSAEDAALKAKAIIAEAEVKARAILEEAHSQKLDLERGLK